MGGAVNTTWRTVADVAWWAGRNGGAGAMFDTGWKTLFAGAVVATLLPGLARAERLAVTFPPGWALSELPAPTAADGQVVAGDRRRAVLLGADGKVVAGIELTEVSRVKNRTDTLSEDMQTLRDAAKTAFADAGLDYRCMDPIPVRAGAQDGLQIDCMVLRHDAPVLHQIIALWEAAAESYALNYSAPVTSGETGHAEFTQMLATVGMP